MPISERRVSERGRLTLPVETRRRWGLADGATVEIVDTGAAIVIVPTTRDGFRGILRDAVDAAGGYGALVAEAIADEPELR
jgi:bifunctional DNA-binding transcriptional regulator/antitoxin component of YhaV-PrlF toxin-antitoxin module